MICATGMLVWAILISLGLTANIVRIVMTCIILAGVVLDFQRDRRRARV